MQEKTDKVDNTTQVVDVGAMVMIDQNVLKHGVIFVCDSLARPFKLRIELTEDGSDLYRYQFSPVMADSPEVTRLVFRRPPDENAPSKSSLILPEHMKKVIL